MMVTEEEEEEKKEEEEAVSQSPKIQWIQVSVKHARCSSFVCVCVTDTTSSCPLGFLPVLRQL